MPYTVKGLFELEKSYRKAANAMARAEARAVKRVGVAIAARQSGKIVETVNVKVAPVKNAIVAKRQPTPSLLQVVFEVTERPISLIEYGGRGSWKGASVQVLRASGRK